MAVDGDGQVFVSVLERRGHGRDDVYFKHEEKGYNSHLSGSISSRPEPVLPNPGFMFFFFFYREIIPIHGPTIQVSDAIHPDLFMVMT